MPIPWLVGVAGAAFLGKVFKDVADDYQDELNDENRKMEELADKTNSLIDKTKKNFEKNYAGLAEAKKSCYETTFVDFKTTFSKLKKVEFGQRKIEKGVLENFENDLVSYHNNADYSERLITNTTASSVLEALVFNGALLPVSMLGSLAKGIKIQYQIDEAKAEYSKLKASCEEAKKQCLQLDSLSAFCDTSTETIKTLQSLITISIKNVEEIIKKSGTNYSKFNEEEKDSIMLMYNMTIALNDICHTEVFDEDGKINPVFKKYVDGSSVKYIS